MHKHHIIPRHVGGTDDSSNLIELTVEQHAEAHRVLFETHGRWQDKIAWEGLSRQIGKEEIIKYIYILTGRARRGEKRSAPAWNKGKKNYYSEKALKAISNAQKGNNNRTKTWLVEFPNGTIEKIYNLIPFCKKYNLDQGALSKVTSGKRNHHKGFKLNLLEKI